MNLDEKVKKLEDMTDEEILDLVMQIQYKQQTRMMELLDRYGKIFDNLDKKEDREI